MLPQALPEEIGPLKEGRKEILLMRATTKVDWHVNVWSEQISGPQRERERDSTICPFGQRGL